MLEESQNLENNAVEEETETLSFGDSAPKKDFEPVEEDDYEFEIESYEMRNSATGRPYLNFKFRIRSDVEQRNAGRCVFYTISKRDEDGKAFNFHRINQLILSQKGTPDYKERFQKGLDEVLLYLCHRHLTAHVTLEDSATGKQFNSISGDTFGPSKWDKTHPAKAKNEGFETDANGVQTKNTDAIDIPDDDVPF